MKDMWGKLDHPLFFTIALLFVLTAERKLIGAGAKKMGWTGIASFFQ